MSPILLALACAGGTDTTPTDVTDLTDATDVGDHTAVVVTDTDTPPDTDTPDTTPDTADPLPPGLNGLPPAVALPAPEFVAVTNRDGNARTRAHLTDGHPTVLWFYPAAGTAG